MYAKRPFGGPKHVIEYLGRYTHKVTTSNHLITAVDAEQVSFTYKDYRDGGSTKTMTLCNEDFTKRFVQHILPHRFGRIRHYGIHSSSWKGEKITGRTKKGACTKIGSQSKNHATQMPLLQNGYTGNH